MFTRTNMGVIISDLRDKKQYYLEEAAKLRRQAAEVEKTEDYPEAKRLYDLAEKADHAADLIDKELKSYIE